MLIEANTYETSFIKHVDILLMSITRPISLKDATLNMRYGFLIETMYKREHTIVKNA